MGEKFISKKVEISRFGAVHNKAYSIDSCRHQREDQYCITSARQHGHDGEGSLRVEAGAFSSNLHSVTPNADLMLMQAAASHENIISFSPSFRYRLSSTYLLRYRRRAVFTVTLGMRSTAAETSGDSSRSSGPRAGRTESAGSEVPTPENDDAESCDLFYDEHADSEDERWVVRNLLHGVSDSGKKPEKLDNESGTNSVSCPSCFSILSMETQPHVRYEGQFRAIFVTNCKTVTSQRLHVKGEPRNTSQTYQPVACANCLTEVGVRDTEGVYHFCNVMHW